MEKVTLINYSEAKFEEKEIKDVGEIREFCKKPDTSYTTWVDVEGKNPEILESLASIFGFHPIIIENVMDADQRPKTDDFESQIYVTLKMIDYNSKSHRIESEHVSLILGKNFIITFQEGKEGDVWDVIRTKLRSGKCKLRKAGSDYLAYSIVDAVIDRYFTILEVMGDKIESLEEEVIMKAQTNTLRRIYALKREMISLRKSVWPVREIVNVLARSENTLISKSTRMYFRDIYEHTIQVIDTVELHREMLISMLDIYLSSVSYNLNAVMKVLTVIATIFIPLTFVTSIYGMNFEFMPELKWKYGYFMIWGIMLTAGGYMLYVFKKKGWF